MEEWRKIPLNNDYEVSNYGSVRSLKKKHYMKIVRPSLSKRTGRGYYQVMLSSNGKQTTYKVHVLVANAFLGYKPNGSNKGDVVDHIDNDPLNNNLENLQVIDTRVNISKDRKGTSKYVGVSYDFAKRKWTARLMHNGKYLYLGRFEEEIDAHKTYQEALKQVTNKNK